MPMGHSTRILFAVNQGLIRGVGVEGVKAEIARPGETLLLNHLPFPSFLSTSLITLSTDPTSYVGSWCPLGV